MTQNPRSLEEGYWLTAINNMEKVKTKNGKSGKITKESGLPDGVTASLDGKLLIVKGPKGESKREIRQKEVSVKIETNKIVFETGRLTKRNKKVLGALMAHVKNMIKGSLQNHTYALKICAGHFPVTVTVADGKLQVKNFLGEKVPRILKLKEGIIVKVEGSLIYVSSASKELAGQTSADIEQITRRPGFDTRVFQDGIYIINKDGKELK